MGNLTTKHVNETIQKISPEGKQIDSPLKIIKDQEIDNDMPFIRADAYNGDPYEILGNVIEVREIKGKCPNKLNDPGVIIEFSPDKIIGAVAKESTKIKEPIKRESIVVDAKGVVSLSFLNYLKTSVDEQSTFSIMVFDQNGGIVDRGTQGWVDARRQWEENNKKLFDTEKICYLFAIVGFVQKYVMRKRYTKFQVGANAGVYGLNINGELYTSNEDYTLDILYGLHTVVLKRPSSTKSGMAEGESETLTVQDKALIKSLTAQVVKQKR
jgi:hypothetical protein